MVKNPSAISNLALKYALLDFRPSIEDQKLVHELLGRVGIRKFSGFI